MKHKVEERDGKWSVFFRNENSTTSFTHLEFEV